MTLMYRKTWRKFCFLLFCLRHKERAHPARPGVRTSPAAQQSRLADGVQPALGCASEATIYHIPKRVPKKAAIVRPTEHLKTAGQL